VIAGSKKYGGPLITVDFGSATTFDMADRTATSSAACWRRRRADHRIVLPDDRAAAAHPGREADKVIGKATVPAMQSGIFWGYVGLIESLIRRIRPSTASR
jgi:type III pantothenate kinase